MSTRSVYYGENKKLLKKSDSVPELGPHDVLIRTKAIAFNPTDFKHLDFQMSDGAALGTDASGEVVQLGSDVTGLPIGASIATFVNSGNLDSPSDGAFSDLIKVSEHSVLKFAAPLKQTPDNEIPSGLPTTYEQAASLPVGLLTAVLAFVGDNDTPIVKGSRKGYALIYGAVSSLGFQATQLAVILGYDVIAVASKKHADLLKSVGVDHLVDYHDEDWVEQARKIGGDDIVYAYDTIAFDDTIKKVLEAVSDSKPVKVNLSLPGQDKVASKSNVKIDVPLAYLLETDSKKFGSVVTDASEKIIERRKDVFKTANELLVYKQIKALPVEVIGDGIDSIPKGVDAIRNGVSGYKVVVRI